MSRDTAACRLAPDLSPAETDLVDWFARVPRPDAPAALRGRILAAARPTARVRLLARIPLGAWGLASAAVLLLALGAAVAVELASPVPAPVPGVDASHDVAGQISIREDATLTLFHDVETFDEVGLAQGEMIADWGR